jgi:hypothetical protein
MYITATITVAIIGFFFTYWNNLRISRRQARLDLVTERLGKFYGPLYIITATMTTAYQTQLSKTGRKQIFEEGRKLTPEEWKENYAWVMGVYVPLEDELNDLVIHNAHLIREQKIPDSLLTLVAHVSVTKALIHKWKNDDFSELYPAIAFPYEEIAEYAEKSYAELKAEQLRFMGQAD